MPSDVIALLFIAATEVAAQQRIVSLKQEGDLRGRPLRRQHGMVEYRDQLPEFPDRLLVTCATSR
jgi:hypothetical protein